MKNVGILWRKNRGKRAVGTMGILFNLFIRQLIAQWEGCWHGARKNSTIEMKS